MMAKMKIYLDDERKAPKGWIRVTHPQEVIERLEISSYSPKERVTEISLDHDLGIIEDGKEVTGYDVLLWLEANPEYAPPVINIHSANISAWKKMQLAIQSIERRKRELQEIGESYS